jgi:hypothetical protein
MSLRLSLRLLPHPYAEEAGSAQELWGEVRLVHENDGTSKVLVSHQWDLLVLAQWMTDQACRMESTELPGATEEGESLARAIRRLQENEAFLCEVDEDAWFDALYAYRVAHSVRFALRGANVAEIILGRNRGVWEVSRADGEIWRYSFDFDEFRSQAVRALRDVVDQQMASSQPILLERLLAIRGRLDVCLRRAIDDVSGDG